MSTEVSTGALVEETRALIREVESGETDRAAWIAIRDRVEELCRDRTQAEVGGLLDKPPTWVSDMIGWSPGSRSTPFGGDYRGNLPSHRAAAKRLLRDPEQREKVIAALTPEERSEVVATVIDHEPRPEPRPTPGPSTTWSALWSYLRNAERGILDALDAMKDQGPPPPEVRAGLEKWIDRLEAAIVVARAHLDNPDGMIDEIEAFLAEAAESPIEEE